ncbi:MAG: DUF1624 domain-containing protein [Hyphomicrobiales bacterium]|nr:MAG: DUF1624 domain-containing protein [Hyphomicrobiales bacterium]
MAVYHFTWDLEFFGYVERGLTGHGGWKLFARCIASSFLFLAGVSLVLAHARGIRWRPFGKRLAQVAAGAVAITIVTYFATPNGFVFFGILHEIALASLLGLAFLRLPFFVTAAVGIAVVALPQVYETVLTNPRWLAWIGMAETAPTSNDFVPLFPWFGAVLIGMAVSQLASDRGWWGALAQLNPRLVRFRRLAFIGRHSLLFYLLHQPLLIALVWLFAQVSPPDPAAMLQGDCRRGCIAERADEAFCTRYCSCVGEKLTAEDLLQKLIDGTTSPAENDRVSDMVYACSAPAP